MYTLNAWGRTLRTFVLRRRRILMILVSLVLLYTGYAFYTADEIVPTRYVPGVAQKQDILVVVSGSGQVAVDTQVDIKAKAAGDVVYIGVSDGEFVERGALLVQLDITDAQKAVRDAEVNLESAQLALQKLEKPATELEVLQATHDLEQAEEDKVSAESDLVEAYEDGFNDVASAFLNLPSIMSGLEGILYDNEINDSQDNINAYADSIDGLDSTINARRDALAASYATARAEYEDAFDLYGTVSRSSTNKDIEALIETTYIAARDIAETVKATSNYIDYIDDVLTQNGNTIASESIGHEASLSAFTNQTSGSLTELLSSRSAIETSKEDIANAERAILEERESLAELEAGTDELDLDSQRLVVKQRENELLDAEANLADYFVRAPFDGVVASLDIVRGESVGASSVLGLLVTQEQVIEVDLNEVDAASVEPGHPTELTFDAFDDLVLSGEVVDVDEVGTVTSGVVTYGVEIMLKETDERIKPGMSVSAEITTDTREGVIAVPNSAVIFERDATFVEVLRVDRREVQGADRVGDRGASPDGEQIQNMSEEERAQLRARRQAIRTAREKESEEEGIVPEMAPERVEVQIGIASDLVTEIVTGLEEGQVVVVRTIEGSSNEEEAPGSLIPTRPPRR